VVLSSSDADTFGFTDLDAALVEVVFEDLVGTFSYLSLSIKLETATENVQFIVIANSCVALPSRDLFLRIKVNLLPDDLIAHHASTDDLLNRFLVHSTNHVRTITCVSQSS